MTPPAIRPALPADAEAIAAAHVAAWRESYRGLIADAYLDRMTMEQRLAYWRDHLARPRQGAATFVAEDPAGLCALASCGPQREDDRPADGEIYLLYILDRAKRRGLGRALMGRMGRAMRDWGAQAADVWALEGNRAAAAFYAAMGGAPDGRRRFVLGGQPLWEQAWLWRDLAAAPFIAA